MSEKFSDGAEWTSWIEPIARNPDMVMKEHYDAIQVLLGMLIEGSGSLTGQAKKQLRQQVQSHLAHLGLTELTQLPQVALHLYEVTVNPPTPPDYPTKKEFTEKLHIVTHTLFESSRSTPDNLTVADVARYGTTNWRYVPARSGNLIDEIYGIGKIMSSELAYRSTFPETDPIVVGDRMHIDNGRHRALSLRTLGTDFVKKQRMSWVDVKRNNGNF